MSQFVTVGEYVNAIAQTDKMQAMALDYFAALRNTLLDSHIAQKIGPRCVHTEHCCIIHGCKYGDWDTCPVVIQKATQSHRCEDCSMERF